MWFQILSDAAATTTACITLMAMAVTADVDADAAATKRVPNFQISKLWQYIFLQWGQMSPLPQTS